MNEPATLPAMIPAMSNAPLINPMNTPCITNAIIIIMITMSIHVTENYRDHTGQVNPDVFPSITHYYALTEIGKILILTLVYDRER